MRRCGLGYAAVLVFVKDMTDSIANLHSNLVLISHFVCQGLKYQFRSISYERIDVPDIYVIHCLDNHRIETMNPPEGTVVKLSASIIMLLTGDGRKPWPANAQGFELQNIVLKIHSDTKGRWDETVTVAVGFE
jgi:hypothetical protein